MEFSECVQFVAEGGDGGEMRVGRMRGVDGLRRGFDGW